jgi:glycosyltransferase involved in cell wall biosynthesis
VVPALFDADIGIVGGAERYAVELARTMSASARVLLVTFGERRETRRIGALTIVVLPFARAKTSGMGQPFSFELFDLLESTDVIHCHQQMALSTSLAAAYANRRGIPVFATDLGGGPSDNACNPDTGSWFDGHLHISRFSLSRATGEQLARSEVIGAGIDSNTFTPSKEAARSMNALFVGRILPHKGIDVLDVASAVTCRRAACASCYGKHDEHDVDDRDHHVDGSGREERDSRRRQCEREEARRR